MGIGSARNRNGKRNQKTQNNANGNKGKTAADLRDDDCQQILNMNEANKRLRENNNAASVQDGKEGEKDSKTVRNMKTKETDGVLISNNMKENPEDDRAPIQNVGEDTNTIVSPMGMNSSASVVLKTVKTITDVRTGERNPLPVHYELHKKELGSQISNAITSSIWADIKFIDKEEALNEKDDFATEIMDKMNVGHDCRSCFWMFFAEEARKRLVKKRANVVTTIRNAANKARDAAASNPESDGHRVPTVAELLQKRSNPVAFKWMTENLLTQAAADRSFIQNVYKSSKVLEWCSVSTEAFVYLVMENFGNDKGTKEKGIGKWTTGTKKGAGWKEEGILRYNKLCQEVVDDRAENHIVDENLLISYQGSKEGRKSKEEDTKVEVVRAFRSGKFGKKRVVEEV